MTVLDTPVVIYNSINDSTPFLIILASSIIASTLSFMMYLVLLVFHKYIIVFNIVVCYIFEYIFTPLEIDLDLPDKGVFN